MMMSAGLKLLTNISICKLIKLYPKSLILYMNQAKEDSLGLNSNISRCGGIYKMRIKKNKLGDQYKTNNLNL